jgi:tRNA modification GTPase
VEAGLDFVDEDIQFISDEELSERLRSIQRILRSTREQMSRRTRNRAEWFVALRGLPNAGKSQLLNALAGREVAIVADVAGTTRDVVTVPVQVDGHTVVLVDTAGIEPVAGESPLEQISRQAQLHANRAGRDADLRLWCVDHGQPDSDEAVAAMQQLAAERRRSAIDLWVATKCDLAETDSPGDPWIATSGATGAGLPVLRDRIVAAIETVDQSESSSVAGTAARCEGSLHAAETALDAAVEMIAQQAGHEYVSAELRIAVAALGEVTGAVYTDDILDRVFSRFCIGK